MTEQDHHAGQEAEQPLQQVLWYDTEFRIRNARRAAGLSQMTLGELLASEVDRPLPFSQPSMSQIERGTKGIDQSMVDALSTILESSERLPRGKAPRVPLPIKPKGRFQEYPFWSGSFDEWKEMNKLPEEFPHLLPIKDEDLLTSVYVGGSHQGMPEYIVSAYGDVAVRMTRGHGITTLARYVNEITKKVAPESGLIFGYGLIPVYLGIDNVDRDQLEKGPRELLEQAIRNGISARLRENSWYPFSEDMDELRNKAQSLDIPQLIDFLTKRGIEVRLHLDLSSRDYYEDFDKHAKTVATLQAGLDNLRMALGEPVVLPPLTVIYFGDEKSLEAVMKAKVDQAKIAGNKAFDEIIDYPSYDSSDLIGILAKRYRPDVLLLRDREFTENLASQRWIPNKGKEYTPEEAMIMTIRQFVSMGFFNLMTGPQKPLVETARLIEKELKKRMAIH